MKPARRVAAIAACGVFLAGFLPGCAEYLAVNQGNYLTFQYPFTDAAAEEVRREAVDLCGRRKLVAIRSENVCNLTQCTTTYQCVDKEDAPGLRR